MSTVRKSHLVFGYVRTNHVHHIPQAVIKLCLGYFDQNIIIKYKGNKLKHFLSTAHGKHPKYKFDFNRDLSFKISVAPKSSLNKETDKEYIIMGLGIIKISAEIDYIIMSWKMSCFENESLIHCNFTDCHRFSTKDENKRFYVSVGHLSQFKDTQQMIFKFSILSMQIKYKNKKKITYYPSISTVQLNEASSLRWNVSLSLIDILKQHQNRIFHAGPIIDQLYIKMAPNGRREERAGYFQYTVGLASFPINISKVTAQVTIKAILHTKNGIQSIPTPIPFEIEITQNKLGATQFFKFPNNKLQDKLLFEANVIILKLYDLDENIVPRNKWIDYNVLLSE